MRPPSPVQAQNVTMSTLPTVPGPVVTLGGVKTSLGCPQTENSKGIWGQKAWDTTLSLEGFLASYCSKQGPCHRDFGWSGRESRVVHLLQCLVLERQPGMVAHTTPSPQTAPQGPPHNPKLHATTQGPHADYSVATLAGWHAQQEAFCAVRTREQSIFSGTERVTAHRKAMPTQLNAVWVPPLERETGQSKRAGRGGDPRSHLELSEELSLLIWRSTWRTDCLKSVHRERNSLLFAMLWKPEWDLCRVCGEMPSSCPPVAVLRTYFSFS